MQIDRYVLGHGARPMIVAEIGAAHNGSLETALALIECAAQAGADAVKIQAFTPDSITQKFDRQEFVISKGPWAGRHLYDLYSIAQTPRAWFPDLYAQAQQSGIALFPSIFSIEDLEFVEQFSPPALKIASFELVDTTLITAALAKQRPLILSTGMADQAEINQAMRIVGPRQCVWLHCVSSYPTRVDKAKLGWMEVLRRNQSYVGLSDHTRGYEVAQMATARGACLIEKHITMTPDGSGLDDGFASGPEDFAAFVNAVERAHAACGGNVLEPRDDSEHRALRRSLYAVRDIAEHDIITSEDVKSIRPGLGLAPRHYHRLIGAVATVDIPRGTPIAEHMFQEAP